MAEPDTKAKKPAQKEATAHRAPTKVARADSAPAEKGDARSTKPWRVVREGRQTGAYRKKDEIIHLTDTEAQFLKLGGHIVPKDEAAKDKVD